MDIPKTWKDIPGFPGYQVSAQGDVRSFKGLGSGVSHLKPQPQCTLKPYERKGYWSVNLYRDGKPYHMNIHRAVLLAFVGPPPPGHEGCHDDGNSQNNWLTNLRWGTKSANALDTVRHGRCHCTIKGEANPGAKYTTQQVAEMRALSSAGYSKSAIAQQLNIPYITVYYIITCRSRAHS